MTVHPKPRIVHVITGLGVGGAERQLARICRSSMRFSHEVVVLADCGPVGRGMREEGIAVHALGASRRWDGPAAVASLWRHLRRSKPDVVQSWLVHANLAASLATPPGTPLVWNVRHTLNSFGQERWSTRTAVALSSFAARRPQRIIYNSARAAEQHEAIGYPREKRSVIANGFELGPAEAARADRQTTRNQLGVNEDERLVGLVARVHPLKNHPSFLEACRSQLRTHPEMRILLVGDGAEPDGELAGKYAEEFGRSILWLGRRDDVLELTAALDIAVNASLAEAFSNTLGEAMSCGVPCVVTDVGESSHIVGDTGWVSASTTSTDLEQVLAAALGCSVDELARRGVAAKERMGRLFSLESAIAGYDDLYGRLCGERGDHWQSKEASDTCAV